MKKINNIKKWFLILATVLIIAPSGMIFIFLFHPQFFIDDIEGLIEEHMSYNVLGKLDIGYIGGNFIQGFIMSNIQYQENGEIIFSASKMYLDPDLSRIVLGDLVVSEIIIWNSYYQHKNLSNYDEGYFSGSNNFREFDFEVSSLVLDKQLIIYEKVLYKFDGVLTIDYCDEIIITFDNLIINSPSFSDSVNITSGSLALNEEQLTFEDTKLASGWIDGKVDGRINYKDYSKSHGNMIFDKISISLNDSAKINLENFNLTLENNDNLSELTISGDMMYQDIQLDNIFMKGVLKEKDVIINSAKFILLNNNIEGHGILNLEKLNWNTSIVFDDIKYGEGVVLSGSADLASSFFFENIRGNFDLTDIQIDSVFIHSANGGFTYSKEEYLDAEINIFSYGYNGIVNIQSFIDENNYNIAGNIKFDAFDIPKYIRLAGRNQVTGNMDFSVYMNNGIRKLNLTVDNGKGYLLNRTFNNFTGNANFIVNDEIITGKSQGFFKNLTIGAYGWQNIDYKVEFSNLGTSTYSLSAFGSLGDSLEIIAEKLSSDKIYLSKLEGVLKQTKIYADPFYIVLDDNLVHLPEINLKIGYGNILLRGNFNDYDRYDLNVEISDVNVDYLYSIFGNIYPIKGSVKKGHFNIKQMKVNNIHSPLIDINVEINNGFWDDVSFDKLSLSTKFNNRRLDPFLLDVETPFGLMRSNGWCNIGLPPDSVLFFPEDSLNFSIAFDKFDLLKVNKFLPWGYETRGTLNGTTNIYGTAEDIKLIGNIDIQNPGFDKIDGKSISSEFTYRNNNVDFSKIHILTEGGRFSGFGDIPIKLDLILQEVLLVNHIPIDFVFTGLANNFELLPSYFPLIDSIKGIPSEGIANSLNIILEITGNLNNPVRNGELIINNGILYLNPIDEVIDNITANIKIKNNILIIDNFNGRMIKTELGQISIPFMESFKRLFNDTKDKVENNIQIHGSIDISHFFKPSYSIHMMANDIHLTSSYNLFQGSGDADMYVSGQDTVLITGKFQPNPNEFIITSLGNKRLYDIELTDNKKLYIYDIHVPLEDGIQVRTENLNALLDGDVTISKTSKDKFSFSGKVNIIDGRFYDKQGNMYENMSGSIFLAPDEISSYMDIHSNTSINTSIIDVTLLGNPNHPVTYFTDNEGRFTQTELLSMLAFGNTEFTKNPNQIQDIFTNYFENEVERNISQNTPLDEFQFSTSGSLLETLEGTEDINIKLILGKRLSNRIYLNTQIDIKDFNENQYEAVYQLSRNSSIVGGLNTSEDNNSLHLKYRLKYYY